MDKTFIIEETKVFVKNYLQNEGSGHDWFHILRVYNLAKHICKIEGGDTFIVEIASLLYDMEDWKLVKDSLNPKESIINNWLIKQNVDYESIEKITTIIKTLSFKGGTVDSTQHTIECMIVQDADRLDAIGAIGIARTFTYGGNKKRLIYDPTIPPHGFETLEQFKNKENHTINHFYEKLLLLKDLMNTKTGKTIAIKRHKIMEKFLEEFFSEWNSTDF